jgi:hypothetical protein
MTGDFSKDLKAVARTLRTTLSSLMTSAGMDPQDPQILSHRWGVNKTLSWKISKVIQTEDAFLALQQFPGREGMDILLKKGKENGIQAQFVDATKNAVTQFEQMIESHCGDRATFEMMGSEATPIGRQQREEQHRKQLFQGASYVWGVQAKTNVNVRVIAPGSGPDAGTDVASISGFLDFRLLRENVRWVMSSRLYPQEGTPNSYPWQSNFEPIDPGSAGQLVPLMPEFCSKPTPILETRRSGNRAVVELQPGPVGNAGVLTYFVGAFQRGLPRVQTDDGDYGEMTAPLHTPVEQVIYDFYMHDSFYYAVPPTVVLSSLLGPLATGDFDSELHQLPLFESLVELGIAAPIPVTPDVPRYTELMEYVFNRSGWNPAEFHGFRIRIAYPPIPCGLSMIYKLAEA